MSPAPATESPSVVGGQLVATSISTPKKGLGGSIIAGAIIGGIVVVALLTALFFAIRHRYRRCKGETDSTTESGPEDEKEKGECAEVNAAPLSRCPICQVVFPLLGVQQAQKSAAASQDGPNTSPPSPQKSLDNTPVYPKTNFSNITTYAPRPQSYRTGQSIIQAIDPSSSLPLCPGCARSAGTNTDPMVAGSATASPIASSIASPLSPPLSPPIIPTKDEHQIYFTKPYSPPTSPPLPPGAMPPIPSPALDSYREQFMASPPPLSPPLSPPQSPSSPGGSSFRRWMMSPMSRSESIRTALPPYERPASGLRRQTYEKEKEKKDESALAAASVYGFM